YVDSLVDGTSRPVTPPELSVVSVNWARDGRTLVVQTAAPKMGLLRVGVEGGPMAVVAEGAVGGGDGWGAGRLVFTRAEAPGAVELVRRDGGGAERALERVEPGRQIVYPRCDAAGVRVAYTVVEGGGMATHVRSDVYLVGLDGGGRRRLTEDGLQN